MNGTRFIWLLVGVVLLSQAVLAAAQESVDLAWDWSPGDSGYTSGPNGDIVYAIYLRSDQDPDYAYDYPAMDGIETCWWDVDRYACETTLTYGFDPDGVYHLVAVAYLAEDPAQRSLSSNEITYRPAGGDPAKPADPVIGPSAPALASGGGGGGGCFVSVLGDGEPFGR